MTFILKSPEHSICCTVPVLYAYSFGLRQMAFWGQFLISMQANINQQTVPDSACLFKTGHVGPQGIDASDPVKKSGSCTDRQRCSI